jgi:hypothetical protein
MPSAGDSGSRVTKAIVRERHVVGPEPRGRLPLVLLSCLLLLVAFGPSFVEAGEAVEPVVGVAGAYWHRSLSTDDVNSFLDVY